MAVFPFLLFALVILFLPYQFVFELDTDLGVYLIKSVLITQGNDLYSDIWSDQLPIFAVVTGKRISTGELSERDIISAIRRYRPEQVALARFELPTVDAYLRQNYRLAYKLTDHRLYVRGDL